MSTTMPPAGLTWAEYVSRWVTDRGGWTQLADALIHRAGDNPDVADDPQTVQRGLRRLANRGHKPGGQYGRWMLRYFGFTSSIEGWVKWMGQYHTRFADLPCGLRLEQLSLWNRPPVAESRFAGWIEVGLASTHRSRLDFEACEHWLTRAERRIAGSGPSLAIEIGLLRGRLETDGGNPAAAAARYQRIEEQLTKSASTLERTDLLHYRARVADQIAYQLNKPVEGAPDIEGARAIYDAIETDPSMPFVLYRRASGLAYCHWKLGDRGRAIQSAQRALRYSGDGGLVRMRVMALNLLSRLFEANSDKAQGINERARRMAALLEDEDLLLRVANCGPDKTSTTS